MILNLRKEYRQHGQTIASFTCHGITFRNPAEYRQHEAGYHDAMNREALPGIASEAYKRGFIAGLATMGEE